MTAEHLIDSETHARLVAVLADPAKLQDFDVFDVTNAIKIALGEIANIWPDSIADDGVEFIDDPED